MKALLPLFFMCCVNAAMAEDARPNIRGDVTLDMDGDARADRAALVENAASGASDLYIFLGGGDAKLDLARPASIIKRGVASRVVQELRARDASLLVEDATGGASDDYDDTLTIVHRNGAFLVAGFTRDTDTRKDGVGHCEINFLTGRAFVSHGVDGAAKPARARVKPVTLADWSGAPPAPCK